MESNHVLPIRGSGTGVSRRTLGVAGSPSDSISAFDLRFFFFEPGTWLLWIISGEVAGFAFREEGRAATDVVFFFLDVVACEDGIVGGGIGVDLTPLRTGAGTGVT